MPAMLNLVDWTIVIRRLNGDGQYGTAVVFDKDLGFRRIPNLHWSEPAVGDIESAYWLRGASAAPITFTYDKRGYRNTTEIEGADVALIGDSFVEGWYVSDE